MAEKPPVAYVEIVSGVLVCTCGHRTDVPRGRWEMALAGQPMQKCEKCGRSWWTPGAADCEEATL